MNNRSLNATIRVGDFGPGMPDHDTGMRIHRSLHREAHLTFPASDWEREAARSSGDPPPSHRAFPSEPALHSLPAEHHTFTPPPTAVERRYRMRQGRVDTARTPSRESGVPRRPERRVSSGVRSAPSPKDSWPREESSPYGGEPQVQSSSLRGVPRQGLLVVYQQVSFPVRDHAISNSIRCPSRLLLCRTGSVSASYPGQNARTQSPVARGMLNRALSRKARVRCPSVEAKVALKTRFADDATTISRQA